MNDTELFRTAVQDECQRLYDLTGVPVVDGAYSLSEGYFRFDFGEPLGEDEIKEIDKCYGGRFFSMFDNRQAFIKIEGQLAPKQSPPPSYRYENGATRRPPYYRYER